MVHPFLMDLKVATGRAWPYLSINENSFRLNPPNQEKHQRLPFLFTENRLF